MTTILSMPDPVDVFVGAKLRDRRRALGLSQSNLGDSLGITFQQIQKYERGSNRISASMMAHAAKALDVSPGWFFEGLPDALTDSADDGGLQAFMASSIGQQWCRVGAALSAEALAALMQAARVVVSSAVPARKAA